MASYSLPSSSFLSANARGRSPLLLPNKSLRLFTVHSFQDEGRSTSRNNNIVDENMSLLKERMEMVKVKERLERCCRCEIGWNYSRINADDDDCDVINSNSNSIMSRRNRTLISDLVQMVGLVCGTVGSTCLSGTLLLCLISLIVHHHSLLSFH